MAASQMATFEGAFTRLKDTVKPRHAIEFQSTTLKDVWDAANEIQRIQRQRKSLRNMGRLKPFLQGLEKYSKCIDTLCNGTPFLPWVWAPVKLILQLASDHPTVLDKLLEAYSQIADALPRFDRFQSAFHYDAHVKQALALVYEDILEFHRNTYRFLKRGAWHILFDSLWKDFGVRFLGILERLERHRDLVDKEASALAIIEAKTWQAQQQENLERLEGERRDRQLQDCISWLAIDDRSQEDALERLSQRRQAGTCEWVLKSSQLRTWVENQNAEPVLWLKGIPGAGKSVLTSHVIQNLRENPDFTTIFFFCNSHTDKTDLCSHVLRTLILELLRSQRHLTSHIFEQYARQGRTPSLGQIKKLLPDLLSAVSSVRIAIDGLDECIEKDQKAILTELLSAVKTSTSPCKIFVSSRAETFISKVLRQRPTISLTEKMEKAKVDEDIQEYVRHSLMGLRDTFTGELVDDVERTVVRKAQGMFLWARLVISELSDRESAYELRKAALNLPQGLHKAYRRILNRIQSEYSKYSSEKAILILQWMSCSFRPLKSFEIRDGLVFAAPDSLLNDETKPNKSLLDLCKPIIEEGVGGTVDFVHFSAKEYILHQTSGPFLKECDAHLAVSFACASYLSTSHCFIDSRYSEEEQVLRVAKGFHGLHLYAHEFMLKHILRYAELQYLSELEFSEVLATRLERLLRFEKPNISAGFKAALHQNATLPATVRHLAASKLPPKLLAFIQNLLIFQDMSVNVNHHQKDPEEIHRQETEYDPTDLSKILYQYQSITEFLIETPENAISGIDAVLVKEFKSIYGESALLCRYRPCPRASIGFSRVRDRDKHESSHTRKFKCEDAACEFQSTGFSTKSALKKHTDMYHRKSDQIILPIRRRSSAASLRELFLDPSDLSSGSDLHRRKLSQLDLQKPWPKQQLGTSSRSPQQSSAPSEFRLHNKRATHTPNFDTYQEIGNTDAALLLEEPQDSLLHGKKLKLADYKERQLKKFDLLQAQRLPTRPSNVLSPDRDVEAEEMHKFQMTDGIAYSKEGVPMDSNSHKKRKDRPSSRDSSGAIPKEKKRAFARLGKDDMTLDTGDKVLIKFLTERDHSTAAKFNTIKQREAFHDTITQNDSPRHLHNFPGIHQVKLEIDPIKLEHELSLLRERYPYDSFEYTFTSWPVDAETELPCPGPAPGQSSEGIKYLYLPRIQCNDCPWKLYAPGPGTSVGDFEIHLKDKQHQERARWRIWERKAEDQKQAETLTNSDWPKNDSPPMTPIRYPADNEHRRDAWFGTDSDFPGNVPPFPTSVKGSLPSNEYNMYPNKREMAPYLGAFFSGRSPYVSELDGTISNNANFSHKDISDWEAWDHQYLQIEGAQSSVDAPGASSFLDDNGIPDVFKTPFPRSSIDAEDDIYSSKSQHTSTPGQRLLDANRQDLGTPSDQLLSSRERSPFKQSSLEDLWQKTLRAAKEAELIRQIHSTIPMSQRMSSTVAPNASLLDMPTSASLGSFFDGISGNVEAAAIGPWESFDLQSASINSASFMNQINVERLRESQGAAQNSTQQGLPQD